MNVFFAIYGAFFFTFCYLPIVVRIVVVLLYLVITVGFVAAKFCVDDDNKNIYILLVVDILCTLKDLGVSCNLM